MIKGNSGDAYVVGYQIIGGTDNLNIVLTCPGDPRWEANGISLAPTGSDAAAPSSSYQVVWLPTRVPIRQGTTLVSTQDGADDCYCLVHVDYPQYGEPYKPRSINEAPIAFEITKTITAGGALTAFTIAANSTNDATFQRGKEYTPVAVEGVNAAFTTPACIGIRSTKYNLTTYWFVDNTPAAAGGGNQKHILPYGLGTVSGGETAFFDFLSTTAETPVIKVTYAYLA